jgi:hypothetical protein
LSRTIEYGLGIHNHLLNDARGLFSASTILPDTEQAKTWSDAAFHLWEHYFPELILEDGSLAEQSSHYHWLLCRTALDYYLAARDTGRTIPENLDPKLRLMFRLLNDLLRPDGTMARFGDSSPDRIAADLWGLLAAADSHGLLDERPTHALVTPLTIYYRGARSATEMSRQECPASRIYSDGGFAILHSPDRRLKLTAHADPSAVRKAHGDAGKGSFELWWDGAAVIREPGCYLTSKDHPLAGTEYQNVTCIDGLAPSVSREDQRALPKWYWKGTDEWREGGDGEVQFVSGAFSRIHPSLRATRTWAIHNGCFSMTERLEGLGAHRIVSRLFLGEAKWGDLAVVDGVFQITGTFGDGRCVHLIVTAPHPLNLLVARSNVCPEYGVGLPAYVLNITGLCPFPIQWSVNVLFRESVYSMLKEDEYWRYP